jgi:hypothetical protein
MPGSLSRQRPVDTRDPKRQPLLFLALAGSGGVPGLRRCATIRRGEAVQDAGQYSTVRCGRDEAMPASVSFAWVGLMTRLFVPSLASAD